VKRHQDIKSDKKTARRASGQKQEKKDEDQIKNQPHEIENADPLQMEKDRDIQGGNIKGIKQKSEKRGLFLSGSQGSEKEPSDPPEENDNPNDEEGAVHGPEPAGRLIR